MLDGWRRTERDAVPPWKLVPAADALFVGGSGAKQRHQSCSARSSRRSILFMPDYFCSCRTITDSASPGGGAAGSSIGSSSSALLFRTLLAARVTGHIRSTSLTAGFINSSGSVHPRQARPPSLRAPGSPASLMQHAHGGVRRRGKNGEGSHHLAVRRMPAFPQPSHRHGCSVCPGDGVGLLAVRHGLPHS